LRDLEEGEGSGVVGERGPDRNYVLRVEFVQRVVAPLEDFAMEEMPSSATPMTKAVSPAGDSPSSPRADHVKVALTFDTQQEPGRAKPGAPSRKLVQPTAASEAKSSEPAVLTHGPVRETWLGAVDAAAGQTVADRAKEARASAAHIALEGGATSGRVVAPSDGLLSPTKVSAAKQQPAPAAAKSVGALVRATKAAPPLSCRWSQFPFNNTGKVASTDMQRWMESRRNELQLRDRMGVLSEMYEAARVLAETVPSLEVEVATLREDLHGSQATAKACIAERDAMAEQLQMRITEDEARTAEAVELAVAEAETRCAKQAEERVAQLEAEWAVKLQDRIEVVEAECIDELTRLLEEKKTLQNRAVSIAVRRFQNAVAGSALRSWIEFVVQKKAVRSTMHKVVKRIQMMACAAVLSRWRQHVGEVIQMKVTLQKVVVRLQNMATGAVLAKWKQFSREKVATRNTLCKVIKRVQMMSQAAALKSWRDRVDQKQAMQATLCKVLQRIQMMACASALSQWREFADEKIVMRSRLQKVILRLQNVLVGAVLTQWKQLSREQQAVRAALEKAVNQMLLQSCAKSFARWRAYCREATAMRNVCHKVIKRILLIATASAFKNWRNATTLRSRSRRVAEKVIKRLQSRCLVRCFEALLAWRSTAKRMRRVVLRWNQRSVAQALDGWRSSVVARRNESERAKERDEQSKQKGYEHDGVDRKRRGTQTTPVQASLSHHCSCCPANPENQHFQLFDLAAASAGAGASPPAGRLSSADALNSLTGSAAADGSASTAHVDVLLSRSEGGSSLGLAFAEVAAARSAYHAHAGTDAGTDTDTGGCEVVTTDADADAAVGAPQLNTSDTAAPAAGETAAEAEAGSTAVEAARSSSSSATEPSEAAAQSNSGTGSGDSSLGNLIMPNKEERARLFRRMDYNGNGMLSLAEIDKAVVELWPQLNHKQVLMMAYHAADVSGDGFIGRREFRLLLEHVLYFNRLWDRFAAIDVDQDQRFTFAEFKNGCGAVGVDFTGQAEAQIAFDEMDEDHGGVVRFTEFCAWCARRQQSESTPPTATTITMASPTSPSTPSPSSRGRARKTPRSRSQPNRHARRPLQQQQGDPASSEGTKGTEDQQLDAEETVLPDGSRVIRAGYLEKQLQQQQQQPPDSAAGGGGGGGGGGGSSSGGVWKRRYVELIVDTSPQPLLISRAMYGSSSGGGGGGGTARLVYRQVKGGRELGSIPLQLGGGGELPRTKISQSTRQAGMTNAVSGVFTIHCGSSREISFSTLDQGAVGVWCNAIDRAMILAAARGGAGAGAGAGSYGSGGYGGGGDGYRSASGSELSDGGGSSQAVVAAAALRQRAPPIAIPGGSPRG
jgi:Ca2+-binding EF-hand superfamily protein